MITKLDYILDRVTMYRLVFYSLLFLLGEAFLISLFGKLSFSPLQLFSTVLLLLSGGYFSNYLLAKIFSVPTNTESVYITTGILSLIFTPIQQISDIPIYIFIAILAMASKYLFTLKRKHIFNPAAIAAFLSTFFFGFSASWWVGNIYLSPFVLFFGFCIIRKLRFFDMSWSFFTVSIAVSMIIVMLNNGSETALFQHVISHSFVLFLAGFMLTDPLTLPSKKKLQMVYGALVGFLSVPQVHLGTFYFAPELALVIGNTFAYIVNPKYKLLLHLKQKIQVASDIYDFIFEPNKKVSYLPGQYMEWTLAHAPADSRGMRRYLTLASSPTENDIRIGVKFFQKGSSYKKHLLELSGKNPIVASQLAGDFTLPEDSNKKLVFIAGGIGITPFRSMIKYLIDKGEKRDSILLYVNKREDEIVYKDVFDEGSKIGLRSIYALTDTAAIASQWTGERGRVTKDKIVQLIPDYQDRVFYLSGPHAMVAGYENILKDLGVNKEHVVVDYFSGLT